MLIYFRSEVEGEEKRCKEDGKIWKNTKAVESADIFIEDIIC
jgi:hypothetical protein